MFVEDDDSGAALISYKDGMLLAIYAEDRSTAQDVMDGLLANLDE